MKKQLLTLVGVLVLLSLFAFAARSSTNPWVDAKLCVGCGDCVSQCPTGAISIVNDKASINDDKCIDCKFCVRACTYRAIRTIK